MSRTPFRLLLSTAAVLTASFTIVPAANALELLATTSACPDGALTQPFLPWGDTALYSLAPDGGFEAGGSGWAFGAGAKVVKASGSLALTGTADRKVLSAPEGATATSPAMCVGTNEPLVRFEAKALTNVAGARLDVRVIVTDALGAVWTVPLASVTNAGKWAPSAQIYLLVNNLVLTPGASTPIKLELTATGGSWQVDDLFLDPYKRA